MKSGKILLLALALLTAGGTSYAAIPAEGVYLNKDGTPAAAEEAVPVRLVKGGMAPMTESVLSAMTALPHNQAALVAFTVDEDGRVRDPSIAATSGSVVLDEYAMTSVSGWTFEPARRGEKVISSQVQVPVRFTSSKVAVPAVPDAPSLKEVPEDLASFLSAIPSGLDLSVQFHISRGGTQESKADILKPEGWQYTEKDWNALRRYASDAVKDWTFRPAQNPDGDLIRSDLSYVLHLPA